MPLRAELTKLGRKENEARVMLFVTRYDTFCLGSN